MEEPTLFIMCCAMFLGSYFSGFLPLYFTLSEVGIVDVGGDLPTPPTNPALIQRRIRLASIFGAGLLVGTALCVIIPEGVSTIYGSSVVSSSPTAMRQIRPSTGDDGTRLGATAQKEGKRDIKLEINHEARTDVAAKKAPVLVEALHNGREERSIQKPLPMHIHPMAESKSGARLKEKFGAHSITADSRTLSTVIGFWLTIGFLFMFVVDHLSKYGGLGGRLKSVPTLGLVIHAAADGIAMGSASTVNESELQLLVFLAIMLHKAPTAFALVSFLMLEGLERTRTKRHLLLFSLSAPIATLITYLLLHPTSSTTTASNAMAGGAIADDGSQSTLATSFVTGQILLFSGGTFLYIATAHVLPELVDAGRCQLGGGGGGSGGHFSLGEIAIFVTSALLPSFVSAHFGHQH